MRRIKGREQESLGKQSSEGGKGIEPSNNGRAAEREEETEEEHGQ